MKPKRLQQIPVLIAAGVLVLVSLVRLLDFDFFKRLEAITYDWRSRCAVRLPHQTATNLGFVFFDETTIKAVKSGEVGFHFGLYWPRQVYGRLVDELAAQGAEAVAFDVLFGDLRDDHPSVQMADDSLVGSDEYFAQAMRRASNVLIAFDTDLPPNPLFATNALGVGDISSDKDADGILRRVRAFKTCRRWHPFIVQFATENNMDLTAAKTERGEILLPYTIAGTTTRTNYPIKVDADNQFELAEIGDLLPGVPPKGRAFTEERVWHMGIMLAAQHLKLDLDHADVDLQRGKITLRGAGGIRREIPVDQEGYFYIDWALRLSDPRMTFEPMHSLLAQSRERLRGQAIEPPVDWTNKLVIVGSLAQGNDLTDRGATPLERHGLLASKHWNVANAVLTGRFVTRGALGVELLMIVLLGAVTALLTWRLRAVNASLAVLAVLVAYTIAAFVAFVAYRYWLPLILPLAGGMISEHLCLVTYRVVFEQRERRRVKSIFSKVVAPEVMNELLGKEKLALGGARREVTVLFADVRGFTELTDYTQERVADYVREKKLSYEQAEACFDDFAHETLKTVNAYLTCVIDAGIAQGGTFDKLIGDCVMFFWNAPVDHQQHARASVLAAIEAQRAIYRLNQQRAVDNRQREIENKARESAGLPPRPPLATLTLGTGINTGLVTAGIMGADTHQINYTVFGREVNLASRLEGMSGRGRIFISETTYQHLLRDDQALAATCIEREPMKPKGFNKPVQIYEVPWMPPGETAMDFQTILFVKPAS